MHASLPLDVLLNPALRVHVKAITLTPIWCSLHHIYMALFSGLLGTSMHIDTAFQQASQLILFFSTNLTRLYDHLLVFHYMTALQSGYDL